MKRPLGSVKTWLTVLVVVALALVLFVKCRPNPLDNGTAYGYTLGYELGKIDGRNCRSDCQVAYRRAEDRKEPQLAFARERPWVNVCRAGCIDGATGQEPKWTRNDLLRRELELQR